MSFGVAAMLEYAFKLGMQIAIETLTNNTRRREKSRRLFYHKRG